MKKKQKIQAQNVSSRSGSTENTKQNKLAFATLRLKQYFVFNAFSPLPPLKPSRPDRLKIDF